MIRLVKAEFTILSERIFFERETFMHGAYRCGVILAI